MKELSTAHLRGTVLQNNKVGIAVYRTPEAVRGQPDGLFRGVAGFAGNGIQLKFDGEQRPLRSIPGLRAARPPPTAAAGIVKQVGDNCLICGQKLHLRGLPKDEPGRIGNPLQALKKRLAP